MIQDTTDTVIKTKTIYESTNPIWYEAVEMSYECQDVNDMPPFVIDIYDEDKNMMTKNSADFLARALIYPSELTEGSDYCAEKPN